MTAAVIGAGLAGAAAARALDQRGLRARLFDKGRGAGGRMSSRRAATPVGDLVFDHGAQWSSARDPEFRSQVAQWAQAGACEPWRGRLVRLLEGRAEPLNEEDRWAGVGGMNAVVKAALAGLDVRFGSKVVGMEGGPGAWRLRFEDGSVEGPFTVVLTALPAEQTGPLLADAAAFLAAEAFAARTAPCWTVLAAFAEPLDLGFDGLQAEGDLAWAAREASKPGRGAAEAWTLQASPEWSRAHLEDDPAAVIAALTGTFREFAGAAEPVWTQAHRWRFAKVERSIGTPFGWAPKLGIGTCGDWRLGPRVEAAWMSGHALGEAVALSPLSA